MNRDEARENFFNEIDVIIRSYCSESLTLEEAKEVLISYLEQDVEINWQDEDCETQLLKGALLCFALACNTRIFQYDEDVEDPQTAFEMTMALFQAACFSVLEKKYADDSRKKDYEASTIAKWIEKKYRDDINKINNALNIFQNYRAKTYEYEEDCYRIIADYLSNNCDEQRNNSPEPDEVINARSQLCTEFMKESKPICKRLYARFFWLGNYDDCVSAVQSCAWNAALIFDPRRSGNFNGFCNYYIKQHFAESINEGDNFFKKKENKRRFDAFCRQQSVKEIATFFSVERAHGFDLKEDFLLNAKQMLALLLFWNCTEKKDLSSSVIKSLQDSAFNDIEGEVPPDFLKIVRKDIIDYLEDYYKYNSVCKTATLPTTDELEELRKPYAFLEEKRFLKRIDSEKMTVAVAVEAFFGKGDSLAEELPFKNALYYALLNQCNHLQGTDTLLFIAVDAFPTAEEFPAFYKNLTSREAFSVLHILYENYLKRVVFPILRQMEGLFFEELSVGVNELLQKRVSSPEQVAHVKELLLHKSVDIADNKDLRKKLRSFIKGNGNYDKVNADTMLINAIRDYSRTLMNEHAVLPDKLGKYHTAYFYIDELYNSILKGKLEERKEELTIVFLKRVYAKLKVYLEQHSAATIQWSEGEPEWGELAKSFDDERVLEAFGEGFARRQYVKDALIFAVESRNNPFFSDAIVHQVPDELRTILSAKSLLQLRLWNTKVFEEAYQNANEPDYSKEAEQESEKYRGLEEPVQRLKAFNAYVAEMLYTRFPEFAKEEPDVLMTANFHLHTVLLPLKKCLCQAIREAYKTEKRFYPPESEVEASLKKLDVRLLQPMHNLSRFEGEKLPSEKLEIIQFLEKAILQHKTFGKEVFLAFLRKEETEKLAQSKETLNRPTQEECYAFFAGEGALRTTKDIVKLQRYNDLFKALAVAKSEAQSDRVEETILELFNRETFPLKSNRELFLQFVQKSLKQKENTNEALQEQEADEEDDDEIVITGNGELADESKSLHEFLQKTYQLSSAVEAEEKLDAFLKEYICADWNADSDKVKKAANIKNEEHYEEVAKAVDARLSGEEKLDAFFLQHFFLKFKARYKKKEDNAIKRNNKEKAAERQLVEKLFIHQFSNRLTEQELLEKYYRQQFEHICHGSESAAEREEAFLKAILQLCKIGRLLSAKSYQKLAMNERQKHSDLPADEENDEAESAYERVSRSYDTPEKQFEANIHFSEFAERLKGILFQAQYNLFTDGKADWDAFYQEEPILHILLARLCKRKAWKKMSILEMKALLQRNNERLSKEQVKQKRKLEEALKSFRDNEKICDCMKEVMNQKPESRQNYFKFLAKHRQKALALCSKRQLDIIKCFAAGFSYGEIAAAVDPEQTPSQQQISQEIVDIYTFIKNAAWKEVTEGLVELKATDAYGKEVDSFRVEVFDSNGQKIQPQQTSNKKWKLRAGTYRLQIAENEDSQWQEEYYLQVVPKSIVLTDVGVNPIEQVAEFKKQISLTVQLNENAQKGENEYVQSLAENTYIHVPDAGRVYWHNKDLSCKSPTHFCFSIPGEGLFVMNIWKLFSISGKKIVLDKGYVQQTTVCSGKRELELDPGLYLVTVKTRAEVTHIYFLNVQESMEESSCSILTDFGLLREVDVPRHVFLQEDESRKMIFATEPKNIQYQLVIVKNSNKEMLVAESTKDNVLSLLAKRLPIPDGDTQVRPVLVELVLCFESGEQLLKRNITVSILPKD